MHVCTYFEPINLVGVYIHISMDKLKILPAGGARREVRESQRWVGLILFMYHEYHVCKKFYSSPSNSGGLTNWLTNSYCHPKGTVIDRTHGNWKWKTKKPQVVGRLKIKIIKSFRLNWLRHIPNAMMCWDWIHCAWSMSSTQSLPPPLKKEGSGSCGASLYCCCNL